MNLGCALVCAHKPVSVETPRCLESCTAIRQWVGVRAEGWRVLPFEGRSMISVGGRTGEGDFNSLSVYYVVSVFNKEILYTYVHILLV